MDTRASCLHVWNVVTYHRGTSSSLACLLACWLAGYCTVRVYVCMYECTYIRASVSSEPRPTQRINRKQSVRQSVSQSILQSFSSLLFSLPLFSPLFKSSLTSKTNPPNPPPKKSATSSPTARNPVPKLTPRARRGRGPLPVCHSVLCCAVHLCGRRNRGDFVRPVLASCDAPCDVAGGRRVVRTHVRLHYITLHTVHTGHTCVWCVVLDGADPSRARRYLFGKCVGR